MALLFLSTPQNYQSLNDDVIYTVVEPAKTLDPATFPNYKYILDLYVNGQLVSRQKRVPDPKNKFGIFEVGRIVQAYCAQKFSPNIGSLIAQQAGVGEVYVEVIAKLGEEYGFEAYYSQLTDTPRLLFNHYLLRGESKLLLSNYQNKLITKRPQVTSVPFQSTVDLITFFSLNTTPLSLTVETDTDSQAPLITVTPAIVNLYTTFNLSPNIINAIIPNKIKATTQWYGIGIGAEKYYVIPTCEPNIKPVGISFLNKLGGFDTIYFTKKTVINFSFERKSYNALDYAVNDIGLVYYSENNVSNETTPTFSVEQKEQWRMASDWLKDDDFFWVKEMLASPLVYLKEGNLFYQISILNSSFEYKTLAMDDFTQAEIDIEFGYKSNSQRR
jgi:hypothetical protein